MISPLAVPLTSEQCAAFYELERSSLTRFVQNVLFRRGAATQENVEDVVQEAFMRFCQKARAAPGGTLRSYLYAQALHACRTVTYCRDREQPFSALEQHDHKFGDFAQTTPQRREAPPPEIVDGRMLSERLRIKLSCFPSGILQRIIVPHFVEGITYAALAREIGMTRAGVRSRAEIVLDALSSDQLLQEYVRP